MRFEIIDHACPYHLLMLSSSCLLFGRTQSLREEIKLLKAKEEKDAKALEDMVQKVEQNLTRTTVSVWLGR